MVWEVLGYVIEVLVYCLVWVLLDLESGLVNEIWQKVSVYWSTDHRIHGGVVKV